MSTPVSQVSPIPLPSPTIIRDEVDLSRPYEYLAEETISPAIGFPEQSGAVVSFHPKCSFYYLTFFVVTFVPAWATLPQPAGFDALERTYEPADPVIFPPGAKQYIRSVFGSCFSSRSTQPLLRYPLLYCCRTHAWLMGGKSHSQGIISHKRQSFPEGNTMRHEQEFITVPHWSLSPEVVGSEAEDESDGEEASPPVSPRLLYPLGAIVSNSMVWVTEADTQAEVRGENRVARNQRKKQKKAQNKKVWEERLEREWCLRASTSIQPDKEALDAWNAPSIYDSVDNSNTLDPLPSKHERASETVGKSILIEPLPSQHRRTSDKGASVEKSSLLEASGPLLNVRYRGSRIRYNHRNALYDSYIPSRYGPTIVLDLRAMRAIVHQRNDTSSVRGSVDVRSLDRGPPPHFEPLPASAMDDRLQEGHMIRDEGCAQEKHHREVEEFSPSRELPLPWPSVNEASDVDSHVSWGAVVGALNEISQVETESYVTQGALEEAAALSCK
ncbi:hypothetical protein BS47DRAFT_1402497 [Hydnum rufescens UP504]|uniref:Uncharacterized protein n=1 Tax=Hydnum rufescens UP504 TaxID=1448309 RepID=A0A9P6DLS1_9AGAM|nr:hypothetical protein BS47DRAFT_1402497 [Hydnum rufescens UP504]